MLALIDGMPRPARTELSPNEIAQHLVLIEDREAHGDEWQRLKDVTEVSPPAMSVVAIALCRAANAQAAERQELQAKLATFAPPQHDWKVLFAERSAYEGDLARYQVDVQHYAAWLMERQRKELRASEARHYSRDADLSRKMTAVAERMEEAENKRRSEVVKPTLKRVKP